MRKRWAICVGGFLGLLGAFILVGLTSSVFTTAACGCGTVNTVVVFNLNDLEALVQQYADEHKTLYPSYDELVLMAPDDIVQHMTRAVNLETGTFGFRPTVHEVGRIGYAVSADRRSHVLIGIGLTERHRVTYLFGRWICDEVIGYEMPILRPGDTPPDPSPSI